ncbi:MAG TPA: universal stress protein [Steroidobacteraceae bacterium]|jgi:nucleotide-binding universal stress UspA family protein|nr:universal stress protein [Steroidobacteraceae bacterium]
MYRKLLVPVDGSAPSNLALLEAIKFIKSMGGGKLRLVHVVDEFVMDAAYVPSVYYEGMIEALRSVGQATLDAAVATVRQHALEPESILLETMGHRVADHVASQAKTWPADLIVMGTHGRRGVRRLLMGSDAELVVRTSPVPILLVRGQPEPV